MRAAIYLRASSEMQKAQGTSIPAQRDACVAYVARKGFESVAEYVDDGISARGARPGFSAMLAAARKAPREFDVLVAYDTDRLSRSKDGALEVDRLRDLGVQVQYVTLPVDYSDEGEISPESEFTESQLRAIGVLFSQKLGRDVLRGSKQVAAMGYRTGGSAPYGYRLAKRADGQAQRTVLEVDADTAKIVRQMFAWKVDGIGDRQIRDRLNAKGLRGPRKAKWLASSVRAIVTNRAYLGETTYNKRKWSRDPDTKKRRPRLKKLSDVIVREGTHEALVDRQTFDAAQAMRTPRHPRQRPSHRVYLLTGLLKCARCGQPAIAKSSFARGRSWPYYRCAGRDQRKSPHRMPCNSPPVRAEILENAVMRVLKDDVAFGKALAARLMAESRPEAEPEEERELERLERKRANLLKAIEDGYAPGMSERYAEIGAAIKELRERIEVRTSRRWQEVFGFEIDVEWLRRLTALYAKYIGEAADDAHRRELVRMAVTEIVVDFEKKTGSMRIGLPPYLDVAHKELCGGWI